MFLEGRRWNASVLGLGLVIAPACGARSPAAAERPAVACPRSSLPKVDPQLLCVMERREESEREGHPIAASPDAPIEVEVSFEGDVAPLIAAGFPLNSYVSGFARAGLSPAQIRALVARDEVLSVRIPMVDTIR